SEAPPQTVENVLLDIHFPKAEQQLVVVRKEAAYRLHLEARGVRPAGVPVLSSSANHQTFSSAQEHNVSVLWNYERWVGECAPGMAPILTQREELTRVQVVQDELLELQRPGARRTE